VILSAKKFETSPRGIRFLEFVQQDEGVIIKANAVFSPLRLIIKRIRTFRISIEDTNQNLKNVSLRRFNILSAFHSLIDFVVLFFTIILESREFVKHTIVNRILIKQQID